MWAVVKRPSAVAVILALIAGLAAAGLGATYVLRQPARFVSVSVLVIDQPRAVAAAGNEGVILKLNALRPKYAALAQTRAITIPVAARAKVLEGEVASGTRVFFPGPSLLMIVDSRTNEAEKSQRVADAMAAELVAFLKKEQDAAKIPAADRVQFNIITPASPGRKFEPTRSRAGVEGGIAGGIALILVYLVVQAMTISRRRQDV
ncbi:MAG: hypothetical protein WAT66_13505 [Actinomycetota bacterium]